MELPRIGQTVNGMFLGKQGHLSDAMPSNRSCAHWSSAGYPFTGDKIIPEPFIPLGINTQFTVRSFAKDRIALGGATDLPI